MKLKVIILQGIPASGKSTWARDFVKGKKDWVIVNRDSFRNGRGDYYIPTQEDYITILEKTAIAEALRLQLNVIIDATNLNPKYLPQIEELVSPFDVEIEKKFFDISLEEAIRRDALRPAPVGEQVIRRFYKDYIKHSKHKNEKNRFYVDQTRSNYAFIFDIDGTTALMDRNPFDYKRVLEDAPNIPVVNLIKKLSKIGEIIFLSGREASCLDDTEKWIEREIGLEKYYLFMREKNDHRSDNIVKKELYKNYIKDDFSITAWIDDRDQVVKMVREELGILCLQCWPGDF